MRNLLSTATVATIGLTCKAFLNLGLCELTVNNHHILLDALKDEEKRKEGTGIVTGKSTASLPASYPRLL